jgi:hypothetical protein
MAFKIALLLSGQARSWQKGYEYHKKNLLDHYDVDVYFHTWLDDNNTHEEIAKLYNAKEYRLTDLNNLDKILENVDKTYPNTPSPQFPPRNTWLMFSSLYESYRALASVREFYDYDVVIRSRFDYALNVQLPYEDVIVGKVYVPSDRMTPNHDFCADMFAFGTSKVMANYCTTIVSLPDFYNKGVTMIGEDMLAAQLSLTGLTGKNMIYVNMNNPFPPGPYNGNYHSLIRDDFKDWNNLRD